MENLDFICIKHGQQMPRDKESGNIIRKALGVLKEDGVYAMFLWIETKNKRLREKPIPLLNESVIKKNLLNESEFPNDFNGLTEKLRDIAQDIDKLLFMKKILERTLIYALYHSKTNQV
jgi:hypothetical protein